ncbi:Cytochrome P450 71B16 [Clarias magur]|uniref:Cytochrome P450 71B16 n=1 Tax=Clarias magur TaxID=1594786 RepID=A0A8J4UFP6_CLAMG|nr:Cytochrome P450 71B16 [Clarias magur]
MALWLSCGRLARYCLFTDNQERVCIESVGVYGVEWKKGKAFLLVCAGHVASTRRVEEGPAGREPTDHSRAYLWLALSVLLHSFIVCSL